MDVRCEIVAERRDLIELLASLSDDDWTTPSLCEGWTVRHVVAHLVTPYVEPPWRTVVEMARHRSVGAAMQAMASVIADRSSTEQLVGALTEHVDDVFIPPLNGVSAPLTDVIVHGADIRIPLGLDPQRPLHRVERALGFVTSWRASPVFVPVRRLRGLRLEATDTSWSAGRGELVRGPAIDLLIGALGRRPGLDRLDGPGAALLRSRVG